MKHTTWLEFKTYFADSIFLIQTQIRIFVERNSPHLTMSYFTHVKLKTNYIQQSSVKWQPISQYSYQRSLYLLNVIPKIAALWVSARNWSWWIIRRWKREQSTNCADPGSSAHGWSTFCFKWLPEKEKRMMSLWNNYKVESVNWQREMLMKKDRVVNRVDKDYKAGGETM